MQPKCALSYSFKMHMTNWNDIVIMKVAPQRIDDSERQGRADTIIKIG